MLITQYCPLFCAFFVRGVLIPAAIFSLVSAKRALDHERLEIIKEDRRKRRQQVCDIKGCRLGKALLPVYKWALLQVYHL